MSEAVFGSQPCFFLSCRHIYMDVYKKVFLFSFLRKSHSLYNMCWLILFSVFEPSIPEGRRAAAAAVPRLGIMGDLTHTDLAV